MFDTFVVFCLNLFSLCLFEFGFEFILGILHWLMWLLQIKSYSWPQLTLIIFIFQVMSGGRWQVSTNALPVIINWLERSTVQDLINPYLLEFLRAFLCCKCLWYGHSRHAMNHLIFIKYLFWTFPFFDCQILPEPFLTANENQKHLQHRRLILSRWKRVTL